MSEKIVQLKRGYKQEWTKGLVQDSVEETLNEPLEVEAQELTLVRLVRM